MSLNDYHQQWIFYLHACYLNGIFLLDRWMLESYFTRLNSYFGHSLRPHAISLVRHEPLNAPVSIIFQPENLLSYLKNIAPQCGIMKLDILATPREMANGKKRSLPSAPVRTLETDDSDAADIQAVTSTRPKSFSLRQIEQWDFLEDDDLSFICQVAQLGQTEGRHCDLCGSSQHLLLACPDLSKYRNDAHKTRRMLSALRGMHPKFSNQGSSAP